MIYGKHNLIGLILVIMLISIQLIPILKVKAEGVIITTYGENEEGVRSDLVTNTANLFVIGINSGDSLSAYKIIDTFYNSQTNEISYEFTIGFKTFLEQNEDYKETFSIEDYFKLTSDNEDGSASDSVITTSTLNTLVSKYATYIRTVNITGIDMSVSNEYGEKSDVTAEVTAGAYLVLPKSIVTKSELESKVEEGNRVHANRYLYGVMVGNVVFSERLGNWDLQSVYIHAKKTSSHFDTMLFDFSTQQYTDFLNGEGEQLSLYYQQNISTYVNKKIVLGLEIWDLPEFPTNAINKSATFTIDFPSGVSYDKNNIYILKYFGDQLVKVTDGKISDGTTEYGTINAENKKVTLDFNSDLYTIIVFDIWLDDDTIIGIEGNKIKTTLTVTNDPYVENDTTDLEIENTIITYGLEITSLGKENTDGTYPLLTGAKYEVYANYDSQTKTLSKKIGEAETGENGTTTFAGVPAGTIYLKQIKAPTGYQLIKDPIVVKIATEDATAGTQEGYYAISTSNDAMWYLPITGGKGTIIYTLIGLVIIAISAAGFIYYRKK